METFEKRSEMPASADDLYAWHMRPEAFDRLVPPWQQIEILDRPERLEEGIVPVSHSFHRRITDVSTDVRLALKGGPYGRT